MPRMTLRERFFAHVKKTTTCWNWTGATDFRGYAKIGVGGRNGRDVWVHRLSWELHYGPIPDGQCVLHKCDNPACVNPDHLFLGTSLQNTHDMISKRRGHWQINAPGGGRKAKDLVVADVLRIRELAEVHSRRELAEIFGITEARATDIVLRRTWKHVA